jgi:hypothetical protein
MDRRHVFPAAALTVAGALAARPARACDPAEMNAYISSVCDGALAPAAAALEAVLPHATPAERALAERHLAAARAACLDGDPAVGVRLATGLARMTGRIESRAGLTLNDPFS